MSSCYRRDIIFIWGMELAAPATEQNGFCSQLTILRDNRHFKGPEYEFFLKDLKTEMYIPIWA